MTRSAPADEESHYASESDTSEAEPDNPSADSATGPVKAVFTTESLALNCKLSFVDFSGLHDKRSLRMLVPLIRPRKLIFVGGDEAETAELVDDCRRLLGTGSESGNDVFGPAVGTTVDASVDTNAWTIKLSQALYRRLQWQKVKGLGVVAITGRLQAASLEDDDESLDGGPRKKLKTAKGALPDVVDQDKGAIPVLDVVPANTAVATRSMAQPFHVGDMRLADLRRIMQSSGMSAEFRGEGTLVVNGTVAVRKTATGKIEVDGAAYSLADPRGAEAGTFIKVKNKIYEGLAVVAGG